MRVLIGYDGSKSADEALSDLRRAGLPRDTEALILWPTGTEVRLITIDDGRSPNKISGILPTAAELIRGSNGEAASAARLMVEWAKDELSVIGLRTSVAFEKGEPQRVLIDEARKWVADTIFVGSRNFSSGFDRFRLGSVSTALVTNAPCSSVEVVR